MIKKFLLLLLCICLITPMVLGDTFTEAYFEDQNTLSTYKALGIDSSSHSFSGFRLYCVDGATPSNYSGLYFISLSTDLTYLSYDGNPGNYYDIPIIIDSQYDATLNAVTHYNYLGNPESCDYWIFIQDYKDIKSLTGYLTVEMPSGYALTSLTGACYANMLIPPSDLDIPFHRIVFAIDRSPYFYIYPNANLENNYNVVCKNDWENSIIAEYNVPFSKVSLTRNGWYSALTISDLFDNEIFYDYNNIDTSYNFFDSQYKINITSPSGSHYLETLTAETKGFNITIDISKNPIGTFENYDVNLNGITDYSDIKRIIYRIQKLDEYGNENFDYDYDMFSYYRTNATTDEWHLYNLIDGSFTIYDNITQSEITGFTHNIKETGNYHITADVQNFDIQVIASDISDVLLVGEGLSSYATYTMTVKDATTGNMISNVGLSQYLANEESGEFEFLENSTVYGSETYNLISGGYYMFNLSAVGYDPLSSKFSVTGTSIVTEFMFPTDVSGGTLSNLIVNTYWEDATTYNERIIEYVKVTIDDDNIKYSNSAGIAKFTGLTTGNSYNYTAEKNGYQTLSGVIDIIDANEILTLRLSKIVEPTPTPTLPAEPSDFSPVQTFVYCVMLLGCSYDIAALIVGCAIVFMAFGMGAQTIGLFGGVFTGCIGLVLSIGLGLLPFYLFYLFILCASLVIAYKLKP